MLSTTYTAVHEARRTKLCPPPIRLTGLALLAVVCTCVGGQARHCQVAIKSCSSRSRRKNKSLFHPIFLLSSPNAVQGKKLQPFRVNWSSFQPSAVVGAAAAAAACSSLLYSAGAIAAMNCYNVWSRLLAAIYGMMLLLLLLMLWDPEALNNYCLLLLLALEQQHRQPLDLQYLQ
jgi:hypothetical protein